MTQFKEARVSPALCFCNICLLQGNTNTFLIISVISWKVGRISAFELIVWGLNCNRLNQYVTVLL